MAAPQESVEAEARLADLRRRLYRADATEADVERYRAELEAVAAPPPDRVEAPARARRPVVGAVAIALAAAVALVVAVLVNQPAETAPLPFETVQPEAERVVSPARTVGGATILPVVIDGTTVAGQRFRGTGRATIGIDGPQGAFDGGRVLIDLTTGGRERVGWRAVAFGARPDWTSRVEIAKGVAWTPFGSTTPVPVTYPAQPPTRIEIDAPQGAGWTLVVAFVDSNSPVEH